jgi:hypothetical protein
MLTTLLFINLLSTGSMNGPLGSDWPATCFRTPNQNLICDDQDNMMGKGYLNYTLGHFDKWYFYKGCIIGVCWRGYFIINEKEQNSLFITKSEGRWTSEIQKRTLKPIVWTKWYTIDDGHDFQGDDSFDLESTKHWGFYLLGFFSLVFALVIDISLQTNGKWLLIMFLTLVVYRIGVYFMYDLLNSF